MIDIPALLSERAKTHGSFAQVATHAQFFRDWVRSWPNWQKMDASQKEAIDSLGQKLARIGCGNFNEPEHWIDSAGYMTLPNWEGK